MYIYIYIYLCVSIYLLIYIYICILLHIYTYIYTHTYVYIRLYNYISIKESIFVVSRRITIVFEQCQNIRLNMFIYTQLYNESHRNHKDNNS